MRRPCVRESACPRLSRPLGPPCPSMTPAHTATERAREKKEDVSEREAEGKSRESVSLLTHTAVREGATWTALCLPTILAQHKILRTSSSVLALCNSSLRVLSIRLVCWACASAAVPLDRSLAMLPSNSCAHRARKEDEDVVKLCAWFALHIKLHIT
jgi:hypothetical protein